MNREFWLDRWAENRIGFHQEEVNPHLRRLLGRVSGGPGRVLVPLCGKSLDLTWLAGGGWEVVGVDLSDIAAKSFASENGLAFTAETREPFTLFRGGGITYYVGDFFDLTPEKAGRFDLVYDRAALIALPRDERRVYAARLGPFLEEKGSVLLIALDYDPGEMSGPPFSVPESEVRSLFEGLRIDMLGEYDVLAEEPRFRERGLTWMKEIVFHIR